MVLHVRNRKGEKGDEMKGEWKGGDGLAHEKSKGVGKERG